MPLKTVVAIAIGLAASATHAQEMAPMLHNGSLMLITQDKERVEIRYENPRSGLSVQSGTVLFSGTRDAKGNYKGTAFVFKKNCEPAPYPVAGQLTDRGIVLVGPAPKRDPKSCDVVGGISTGPSRLVFEYEPEPG